MENEKQNGKMRDAKQRRAENEKKMDEWLKGSQLSPQRHFMNAREGELTAGALRAVCVFVRWGELCYVNLLSLNHETLPICCVL